MPVPKPKKGEKSQAYISRLISFFRKEGYPQEQAIAMAYSSAKKAGYKVPTAKGKSKSKGKANNKSKKVKKTNKRKK